VGGDEDCQRDDETILGLTKTLVGHVGNWACPEIKVDIQLTLSTPANASRPVPMMMEFGFGAFPGFGRGKRTNRANRFPFFGGGPRWQDEVASTGRGSAVIVPMSYQADNGAELGDVY